MTYKGHVTPEAMTYKGHVTPEAMTYKGHVTPEAMTYKRLRRAVVTARCASLELNRRLSAVNYRFWRICGMLQRSQEILNPRQNAA
ncbi:MAG: hypothetical protein ACK47M_14400 [Caldilinea sp.]